MKPAIKTFAKNYMHNAAGLVVGTALLFVLISKIPPRNKPKNQPTKSGWSKSEDLEDLVR